ncbi:CobD/CbiB family protein [Chitinimonas sp. BJB300]|uniref:CobD/CbiB family protein n=1 Tax=Chitinimonas sp. BJB300 TaxID=1559339 RepID=UPI000C11596B|nr:CobD/CbiB family protein [Chitinimonas sp. BJB300]PHV10808.1 threonine-phosphate decarboxylase [Chitinimonas sp. BJB300]TSJ87830.1 CobD/CbiB family protein [Chitinimonas sp. BJB300]
MTWLALVLALVLEQLRPLERGNVLYAGYRSFSEAVERNFNAGEYRHGVVGWLIAVITPTALVLLVWGGLYWVHWALAWLFGLAVLYVTMGFRQFSSAFTGVADALKEGDLPTARQLLAGWTREPSSELSDNEVARLAIEQGLIDAYRHVFGPMFWFIVLGPAGAVAYRSATILQLKWGARDRRRGERFGNFADKVGDVVDWLPIRVTAVSFAVVGDFEDAVFCWRQQAERWTSAAYGILLAAGAGAIGVRLGMPLHQNYTVTFRPELGLGEEADANMLNSAVGLVWRTLLCWLLLMLMVTIAVWF